MALRWLRRPMPGRAPLPRLEYFPLGQGHAGAGTAPWDHVTIDSSLSALLIPMKLHIDGIQSGAAGAKVRYYVGRSDPFQIWNTQLSQGWNYVGAPDARDIDVTLDIGQVLVQTGSTFGVYIELDASATATSSGTSFAGFGHTARFEWELPPGLTFTSASGQFMTAPVPEPGTWALMLAGLAGVGSIVRRRLADA